MSSRQPRGVKMYPWLQKPPDTKATNLTFNLPSPFWKINKSFSLHRYFSIWSTVISAMAGVRVMRNVTEIKYWVRPMTLTHACNIMSFSTMDQWKWILLPNRPYPNFSVNSSAKETYPKFATILSMSAKESAVMKITATREIFWTQLVKIPAARR